MGSAQACDTYSLVEPQMCHWSWLRQLHLQRCHQAQGLEQQRFNLRFPLHTCQRSAQAGQMAYGEGMHCRILGIHLVRITTGSGEHACNSCLRGRSRIHFAAILRVLPCCYLQPQILYGLPPDASSSTDPWVESLRRP